jgi:hypothetical protein
MNNNNNNNNNNINNNLLIWHLAQYSNTQHLKQRNEALRITYEQVRKETLKGNVLCFYFAVTHYLAACSCDWWCPGSADAWKSHIITSQLQFSQPTAETNGAASELHARHLADVIMWTSGYKYRVTTIHSGHPRIDLRILSHEEKTMKWRVRFGKRGTFRIRDEGITITSFCRIRGSHSRGYGDLCLLGYNAVQSVESQRRFGERIASIFRVEE